MLSCNRAFQRLDGFKRSRSKNCWPARPLRPLRKTTDGEQVIRKNRVWRPQRDFPHIRGKLLILLTRCARPCSMMSNLVESWERAQKWFACVTANFPSIAGRRHAEGSDALGGTYTSMGPDAPSSLPLECPQLARVVCSVSMS